MKVPWVLALLQLCLVATLPGVQEGGRSAVVAASTVVAANATTSPLVVGLTLIQSAVAKGAVCLDGTPPGYHLHRGHGSGSNSWVVGLQGGAWCNDIESCIKRTKTYLGSSIYMDKTMEFHAILSNKPEENPDFYNWNRVWVQYCDGASFAGEGYNEAQSLYFRGQRIWSAVMEDLMSKGMRSAEEVLLTGCSAGGLATLIHCDEFRALFPASTKVKCMADAALFLDVANVSGQHVLRSIYEGVVSLQGVAKNLPATCTTKMDPALCFFPQHLLGNIQTPTFLLNAAYDSWQIRNIIAPESDDPADHWQDCRSNHLKCNAHQIKFLQGFRNAMLNVVRGFSASKQNGLFINSCFTHCQIRNQNTWYGENSSAIANKSIAKSVGDWYFDRAHLKAIDCPYPCDHTCIDAF